VQEEFTLDNKSILVTGGTGSFGKRFIKTVLERYTPKKVVVFSRDELKQFDMQNLEPYSSRSDVMRYFIGDVRDEVRLVRAMEGIDVVIHAAALKQVPAAEYNPFEAIKTNVIGAENVISACMATGVSRVIALSTDKAAAPINLYGATKLASDKLFVAANNFRGSRDIRFSVVRYGNVMGSRGSVIPFFTARAESGVLPITDPRMTRFNITLSEGVEFVPRIPSYRITDIALAVAPDAKQEIVGIRPGEKLHEEMITKTDALGTVEFADYFVILPSFDQWDVEEFRRTSGPDEGRMCEFGFSYDSGTNEQFLTVDDLKDLITRALD
jgi:UDP-N-acetylglucosamine 4,6-dehydratase (inverting)